MADKLTGTSQMPNSETGEESPKTFTIEELEGKINQVVHAAITARNRSLEEKLGSQFAELKTMLTPKEDVSADQPKKKSDSKVDLLQAQLDRMKEKDLKARDANLRGAVKEQFLSAGFSPAHVKALVALHVDAEKNVSYASEDSDDIIWRTSDSIYSLTEGVSNFAKSDDAKSFLAPRGTTGSGDKSYTTQSKSKSDKRMSREEMGNTLIETLLKPR